jgi:hypothetical protein
VAAKLSVEASSLVAPRAPAGTTNSITASLTAVDSFKYIAKSTVNDSICQTDTNGGCDEFTLNYKKEGDESTISLKSRRSGRGSGFESAPTAPTRPTITAVISSSSITATSSVAACQTGTTAKYSFQYQTGAGGWSTWTAWSTTRTYSKSGNTNNTVYSFKVKARCDNGPAAGAESQESLPVSVNYLAAPAVTITNTATTVTATVGSLTCASGGTVGYRIDSRTNVNGWTTGAWQTGTSFTVSSTAQGTRYGFRAAVRCVQSTRTDTSATSAEQTYVVPIAAPGLPSVVATTVGDDTTWNWTTATCPTGTDREYQVNTLIDSGYTSGWSAPGDFTSSTWGTYGQGYEYVKQVQARCKTAYATSPWSSTGGDSYIRPVAAPGAPTNFNLTVAPDRHSWRISYTHPTCGDSTVQQHRWGAWLGTGPGTWGWLPGPYRGWLNKTSPYWDPYGFGSWVPYKEYGAAASEPAMPTGLQVRIKLQYRCINTTTNRMSGNGPETLSPIFTS